MSANNDSIQKTLLVAVLLCLVCSIIVAGAAVSLKPLQIANKEEDKRRNILVAAGLWQPGANTAELFEQISPRLVNLAEGRFATNDELAQIRAAGLNPEAYDQIKAAKLPALSQRLDSSTDIASIRRLEHFAEVFMVYEDDVLKTIVMPVHGYGLWSTLYGFIALENDLNTVAGFGFYAHAETPGLGGEVDNPNWKEKWIGKRLNNDSGELAIEVIKGEAPRDDAHRIDGLSGATLTARGVNNLVRFWVGDNAFGPFLANLKHGEI